MSLLTKIENEKQVGENPQTKQNTKTGKPQLISVSTEPKIGQIRKTENASALLGGPKQFFKHLASDSQTFFFFLLAFLVVVHYMTNMITTSVINVFLLDAFLIAQGVEQVKNLEN